MPVVEKEFMLKYVFNEISSMKDEDKKYSNIEEHYGVPWCISVQRNKDHLGLVLHCEKKKQEKEWSIEVSYDMRVCSINGNTASFSTKYVFEKREGRGHIRVISWKDMMIDYVIDDTLNVEIHVKIKKMTGIYEQKILRNFDESNKKFSDVILVLDDQKFYISKLFLASQSSYFKSLLLENVEESNKEEVTLTGAKAADFQNFLESLHSEPSINDDTVTGILRLANMYGTKTVRRQCEEFLMKESQKSTKVKLQLAAKYKLENLKNKCLLKIKTMADIRSIVPDDPMQLDKDVLASLLQKSISYQN